MAINKVVYGNNTLIDLTGDSVEAGALLNGYTAHDRSGASITGSILLADIVDNLTTSDATKALSAKQGKVLNDTKQNNIWTGTQAEYTAQASSIPNGTIVDITDDNEVIPQANIVDNLTTQDATKALSANQGYVLKGLVDSASSAASTANTNATKALGVFTTGVSASIGDTYVDITDAAISDSKILYPYFSNTSGDAIGFTNITVTSTTARVTFAAALEEAATVYLHIREV